MSLTERDLRIVTRTRELPRGDFAQAVANLKCAVEELIPAGQVWPLASTPHGPVLGSRITGLAVAESAHGVMLVRVRAGVVCEELEPLW